MRTFTYLKQIYPGVKITLLHRSYVKDIVPICDSIDDFISIEETDIISNPDKFINIVLDKKIDACVNLVGHVSQNMAKKISLAIERNILKHLKFYIKRKDGLKLRIQVLVNNIQRKIQNDKITNCLYSNITKNILKHEIYRNILSLKNLAIGTVPEPEILPDLYKLNIKSISLNNELQSIISPEKINLIMHPKSNGHCIEWPLINYAQLIDILDSKAYRIILTGSLNERIFIDEILRNIKKHNDVINLAGKTNIQELSALINLSDGILSGSTGPMHIAAALGTYTLGIFPWSKKRRAVRVWFPVGYDAHIIQDSNLDNITPQLVFDTLEAKFSKNKPKVN
ncbi:MAG: glycosyltransferase family 9 protein [Solitalea-like symbiont of Acarus siro]